MRRLFLGLASMLLVAAPAEARWREASTDHFLIYSEESAESLQAYATKLERYDAALRHLRGMDSKAPPPASRLTVYVVDDLGDVRRLHGRGQRGVGGFYLPRAEGSIAITPRSAGEGGKFSWDSETILLHEYAHHFMMQNFPGAYPAWFVEGFAELHSTAKFEKDGSIGLGLPALHRARGLLSYTLPIETLLGTSGNLKPGPARESLYGRGWLLTHYLYFEDARKGQLRNYIGAVNAGKSPLVAAQESFGDLKALDRELNAYLRQRKMKYLKLEPVAFKLGPVRVREMSAAEDAVMDVKIRSRRGGNRAAALELLPAVRRAAGPYPNDPMVQATLAEAEFDAGNFAEAEAAADRALAADPKHGDALIYKGRARMGQAIAGRNRDPKTWSEARRWFVAANKLDPHDPEPLILFYQSFRRARMQPTPNAVTGLLQAYDLAPHDMGLRMNAAVELLRKKDLPAARAAVVPIAFNPHGGRMSEAAASILALIDSGKLDAAVEAMEAGPGGRQGQGDDPPSPTDPSA